MKSKKLSETKNINERNHSQENTHNEVSHIINCNVNLSNRNVHDMSVSSNVPRGTFEETDLYKVIQQACYDQKLQNINFAKCVAQDKLEQCVALLIKWNSKINLISKSTVNDIYKRHILDSLQIIYYFDIKDKIIIDLGSGAGFPGIVLALTELAKINLVESDQRKYIFLNQAAKLVDNVTIYNNRIEDVPYIQSDIVTARALAPLDKLLSLAVKFNHPNIEYIFLKGENINSEIIAAQKIFDFNYKLFPSLTNNKAFIIRIHNLYMRKKS